ncbi:MAG: MarR family winged helix-turn-helix transcriptional regulator [Acidimicrobiales bacterium]
MSSTAASSAEGRRAGAADRAALIERFFALQPLVSRRLRHVVPPELHDELGSVTLHQLEALHHLEPDGLTMSELAHRLDVSEGTATALADRLVRQGLAERSQDVADRRVVHLVPSPRAAALVGRLRKARRLAVREALAALDDSHVRAWLDVLEALATRLEPRGGSERGHGAQVGSPAVAEEGRSASAAGASRAVRAGAPVAGASRAVRAGAPVAGASRAVGAGR